MNCILAVRGFKFYFSLSCLVSTNFSLLSSLSITLLVIFKFFKLSILLGILLRYRFGYTK